MFICMSRVRSKTSNTSSNDKILRLRMNMIMLVCDSDRLESLGQPPDI